MNLTEKNVSKLKPPNAGNRIVYDGEIPGFGARITAAGVLSFVLNYRINGREHRFTIGRIPELSVASARDEAIKLRNQIRNGEDPLAHRQHSRIENPTVKDLAARYLSDYAERHKRPTSIRNDKGMLEGVIVPQWGRREVAAVTKLDVENLHRKLEATPYRANRMVALLGKVFSLAIEWGWRTDNPARGVRKYPEAPRTRWLDRAEIDRVLVELDKYPDRPSAIAIGLLLYTGARKGEVLAARWEHMDLENERWTKPRTNTKQKREEIIPLGTVAVALLRKLHQEAGEPDNGWVFSGRSEGEHLENLKQHWPLIRKAAKLGDEVRLHDLRHTFASHLVSSGESLQTVGALLGHTQTQTTMRYAHLADTTLRNAANSFMRERVGK
jgi:integrase